MAKVTITNEEMLNFRRAAQNYINRHPDRTRLHYALEKTLKKTTTAFEDYADAESDIRIDTAMIDEKTKAFVMTEDKMSYVVDPTKAKDLQKRMRDLGRKKVEFESYFATEIPKDLEAAWYQVFEGIVIEETDPGMIGVKKDVKKEVIEAPLIER